MAPFLRASLRGLRSSLCSSRKRCLQESGCSYERLYSECSALQSASQMIDESSGEDGVTSKDFDYFKQKENTKETSYLGARENEKPQQSTTDSLTNLIIGKMRSKGDGSGLNKVSAPSLSMASKGNRLHTENRGPDKWDQVMASMRNMTAKKKQESMKKGDPEPISRRIKESGFLGDFVGSGSLSQNLSKALRSDADKPLASLKGPAVKDRTKGEKPVRFGFLKALEGDGSPTRHQVSGGATPNRSQEVATSSGSNITANESQGSSQSFKKEAKPTSFEHLNSRNRASFVDANDSSELGNSIDKKLSEANCVNMEKPVDETNKGTLSSHSGHMVCVKNLPNEISLGLIKEALSNHGEVVSSFKKPNPDGSFCAFIEYKTADAMDSVLASRWLQVDTMVYAIVRADCPLTTVVRLNRVSPSLSEGEIRSICEKLGNVDYIRKRGMGIYDVFYMAENLSNISNILNSLNDATLSEGKWVAVPAPILHRAASRSILNNYEGRTWFKEQVKRTLDQLETGLQNLYVNVEDLKSLHAMEDEMR
ncbi:hypothetical protein KP509_36G005600 [Ceratopteris richardii]|uniref:RRM domain-containing protein n=2 Tax=Ceratopteris richardii TaxID=49495 RepID=A0A8T2QA45_CERRI|nr:hypothetical protein KP509_36G005600 [Ceratopteris richardii]